MSDVGNDIGLPGWYLRIVFDVALSFVEFALGGSWTGERVDCRIYYPASDICHPASDFWQGFEEQMKSIW